MRLDPSILEYFAAEQVCENIKQSLDDSLEELVQRKKLLPQRVFLSFLSVMIRGEALAERVVDKLLGKLRQGRASLNVTINSLALLNFLEVKEYAGVSLAGRDLRGIDFAGASLASVNLSRCNLSGLSFEESNLSGCDLSGASLGRSNLAEYNLQGANMSNVDLSNVKNLYRGNLENAKLKNNNLKLITLRGHESGVNIVAYAPGGEELVSGSLDKTVRIWSRQGVLLHT